MLHTLNVYKIFGKQSQAVDSWVTDEKHKLNVYKIPAKENQVVNSWAENEISVSQKLFWKYLEYVDLLMLPTYKKLKQPKIVRFYDCSIFGVL